MTRRIFITATDTNAGKTYITAGLLRTASARGLRAAGIKPVASGAILKDGMLHNEDIHVLQQASSPPLTTDIMNAYIFEPPIAPHIAAAEMQQEIDVAQLMHHAQYAMNAAADIYLIEGFGGWHAPLNMRETMADYAVQLNCDVIIIVGLRVGCLNHAILTARAIQDSGARCIGWIANMIDPQMTHQLENITTLETWLQLPLLGIVKHGEASEVALSQHTIF